MMPGFGQLGFGLGLGYAAGAGGAPSGLFNFNSAFLANFAAAVRQTLAGETDTLVVLTGDSTIAGTGYGSDKTNNVANRLALALVAAGLPARNEGVWTAHGSATPASIDAKLSVGAGWNVTTSLITHGGRTFRADGATVTTALSYTPYASADVVDIWYVESNIGGYFSVSQNGGTVIQYVQSNAGSTAVKKVSMPIVQGTGRLDIKPFGGSGTIDILGVVFRNRQKSINIINAGFGGARVADFNSGSSAYSPRQTFRTLAPKLTFINLVINDANAGTDTSTYQTNIQNLITDAKLSGDVIMVIGPPSWAAEDGGTAASKATQKIYRDIIRAVAVTNNCPLVDLDARWISWPVANARGLMSDALHPDADGYADFGLALSLPVTALQIVKGTVTMVNQDGSYLLNPDGNNLISKAA